MYAASRVPRPHFFVKYMESKYSSIWLLQRRILVGIIVGFAMGRRRVLLADYFEMPKLVPVTIAHSTQFAHSITYLIVACLGFALNSIVQTPVPHICCELPHLGDNLFQSSPDPLIITITHLRSIRLI